MARKKGRKPPHTITTAKTKTKTKTGKVNKANGQTNTELTRQREEALDKLLEAVRDGKLDSEMEDAMEKQLVARLKDIAAGTTEKQTKRRSSRQHTEYDQLKGFDMETITRVLAAVAAAAAAVDNDGSEGQPDQNEFMDVEINIDSMRPEALGDLFGDGGDKGIPQTPGGSLQLPPRPSGMSQEQEILEDDRSQQYSAMALRSLADSQAAATNGGGRPRDMRLVLQSELKREENLLKDLRAEIVDKIFKLETEEKLLRKIVKGDFQLPPEEHSHNDDQTDGGGMEVDNSTNILGEYANDQHILSLDSAVAQLSGEYQPTQNAAEGDEEKGDGSDSDDGSLSGMTSTTASSDEDIQDEELERVALNEALGKYLPQQERGS